MKRTLPDTATHRAMSALADILAAVDPRLCAEAARMAAEWRAKRDA